MSSSQQQPSNNNNNNNNNNPNPSVDYETDESLNSQRYSQQQMSGHPFNNRRQLHENDSFQAMYHPYQQDIDEDLPSEFVATFDGKTRVQSNINDEDQSVFSDVVQDAFKKYQNEQEELYAQMEECWNYMAQESGPTDQPKPSAGQSQLAQLNPDAIEFKPSWLQSSTNEEQPSTLPSSQANEQEKII